MMRALRSEWLGPRVFALLSALSLVAAIVYPSIGALWGLGPWLLFFAGFGWISHDMSDTVRRRHRDWRVRNHRVEEWAVMPPRVSADPDVSLLARVLATPDPRMDLSSANGWLASLDAAEREEWPA